MHKLDSLGTPDRASMPLVIHAMQCRPDNGREGIRHALSTTALSGSCYLA